MIEALALAAAYIAGVGPARMVLLAGVLFVPIALIPLILATVVLTRRSLDDLAPLFCDSVATELRSGSTLRSALLTAARSVDITLSEREVDGLVPVDVLADGVAREIPALSPELESLVRASARSGGAVADLFDELGATVIAQNEIAREVRIASAPARASAWFFVVAPTVFIGVRALSGGFDGLLAVPGQRIAAAVGMLLFVAGLSAVGLLVWRAQ